jgi:hypothetical protein
MLGCLILDSNQLQLLLTTLIIAINQSINQSIIQYQEHLTHIRSATVHTSSSWTVRKLLNAVTKPSLSAAHLWPSLKRCSALLPIEPGGTNCTSAIPALSKQTRYTGASGVPAVQHHHHHHTRLINNQTALSNKELVRQQASLPSSNVKNAALKP